MKKITKEQHKEAVKKSLKIWLWLFKNPEYAKPAYPYFYIEEYNNDANNCPLCTLYIRWRGSCDYRCPLLKNKTCGFIGCGDYEMQTFFQKTAFYKWTSCGEGEIEYNDHDDKKCAARIAGTLRRELRRIERKEKQK